MTPMTVPDDVADPPEPVSAHTPSPAHWRFPVEWRKDSVRVRIARYDFLAKRCTFYAAGLAGILLLTGQELLDGVPALMRATIATIAVAGIVFAAFAYLPLLAARDALRAASVSGKADAEPLSPFPNGPLRWFWLSMVALIVAGALIVIGIWWSIIA